MFTGALLWSSKAQVCVKLSSTEAAYESLARCTKDVLVLRQLLEFLRCELPTMRVTVSKRNDGAN